MGGDGGDGGAAERTAKVETEKVNSRRQLNYLFGEGTPGEGVDRNKFYSEKWSPSVDEYSPSTVEKIFDQSAYDAAVAAAGNVNPNKAAREELYTGVRENAFNSGKRALDEAKEKASRQNKFALFAQGLNGGSEDIDQNALLGQTYGQGLLDLGAKADGAKAQFKTSDENTRLGLLQSIDAGIDQSSAISSAVNQMKNNLDNASSQAQSTNLGDLFAQSGALYTQTQAAKGKQAASDWWNQFTSGGNGKANSTARTGLATPTY